MRKRYLRVLLPLSQLLLHLTHHTRPRRGRGRGRRRRLCGRCPLVTFAFFGGSLVLLVLGPLLEQANRLDRANNSTAVRTSGVRVRVRDVGAVSGGRLLLMKAFQVLSRHRFERGVGPASFGGNLQRFVAGDYTVALTANKGSCATSRAP